MGAADFHRQTAAKRLGKCLSILIGDRALDGGEDTADFEIEGERLSRPRESGYWRTSCRAEYGACPGGGAVLSPQNRTLLAGER